MHVSLTLKSSNVKTGPIPVSTTSASTCSDACPFKANGCYADSGPLALHWRATSAGLRGTDWNTFCSKVAALPAGTLWRHNQAGDLPGNGDTIDTAQLSQLVSANRGKHGFTYTHKPMSEKNAQSVKEANLAGFTVNLSANNLAHADTLSELAIAPVTVVIPHDTVERTLATPSGRKVVVCPATYRDDVTCQACQLCARQRDIIVAFPAHGTGKNKASTVARGKD